LGELTTTGVDGISVVFGEAAPDAVRLADSESVGCALHHDGAGSADGLGSGFARRAGGAALTFRVEKNSGILSSAGAFELPIPNVGIGPWKPGNVGHVLPPLSDVKRYQSLHTLVK
jgi:hypothetical protein